jgi:outer membrane receptor for ferrienterochelin and colicin
VAIDPLVIEQIDVVRGPAALLYGGSAVGGVVNAIDHRIPTEPVNGIIGRTEARLGGPDNQRNAAAVVDVGNGQFAMQHPDGGYNSSAPACGTENTMTVEVDLGKNKSGTYPFEVYDQNNNLLWSGNITVTGNTCVSQELVW